jgi:hypothetical protein
MIEVKEEYVNALAVILNESKIKIIIRELYVFSSLALQSSL